ncbi:MAG TPA: heme exporter protein CcmB [Candidatus Binatia bacterium]|nr:heme exporter protein CcmB [Candidatus Binatia bacterium]
MTRVSWAMWAIVRKDLAIELRTREMLSSLFLLAFLVVLVFAFALEPERLAGAEVAAGLLWASVLFAGTLSLDRSFGIEREAGAWTALALLPIDRGSVYLAKAAANAIVLLIGTAALLPLIALLLGTRGIAPSAVLPVVVLLGVAGIAAIGTLCAAIATRSRARAVLMPLLTFPLLSPVLIAAARATAGALVGRSASEVGSWLLVLGGFDIVFLTAGWLTFDYVLEE